MRNLILSATLMAASLFGATAHAEFEAGKQYVELNSPVQVAKPGKIEVVELFWYGCGHCYQFESTLNPWVEQLPEDVNFVRIPALFGGMWNVHGQLFITLDAMKAEHKLHAAVFYGIHKQCKKLATPEELSVFLEGVGLVKDAFIKTFYS
jgi:thiol:disulfide interchange protein DsbA